MQIITMNSFSISLHGETVSICASSMLLIVSQILLSTGIQVLSLPSSSATDTNFYHRFFSFSVVCLQYLGHGSFLLVL